MAGPDSAGVTSCLEIEACPNAPYWARQHAQAALGAWRIPPEAASDAVLVLSELVTNAIRACEPGAMPLAAPSPMTAGLVRLTIRCRPGRLVIEVFDQDPSPPAPAGADADGENGRGLMIVGALSQDWGYRPLPSGGKVVYAIVPVTPPAGDVARSHQRSPASIPVMGALAPVGRAAR